MKKKQFICGEAENGQVVLDRVLKEIWDVVILDISMPGLSGLEILKEIKKNKPKLPVLVLTMHSEDQFALRSIKAGAAGYLLITYIITNISFFLLQNFTR